MIIKVNRKKSDIIFKWPSDSVFTGFSYSLKKLPDNITELGSGSMSNLAAEEINLNKAGIINASAFENNTVVKKITVDGANSYPAITIKDSAFKGTTNLKEFNKNNRQYMSFSGSSHFYGSGIELFDAYDDMSGSFPRAHMFENSSLKHQRFSRNMSDEPISYQTDCFKNSGLKEFSTSDGQLTDFSIIAGCNDLVTLEVDKNYNGPIPLDTDPNINLTNIRRLIIDSRPTNMTAGQILDIPKFRNLSHIKIPSDIAEFMYSQQNPLPLLILCNSGFVGSIGGNVWNPISIIIEHTAGKIGTPDVFSLNSVQFISVPDALHATYISDTVHWNNPSNFYDYSQFAEDNCGAILGSNDLTGIVTRTQLLAKPNYQICLTADFSDDTLQSMGNNWLHVHLRYIKPTANSWPSYIFDREVRLNVIMDSAYSLFYGETDVISLGYIPVTDLELGKWGSNNYFDDGSALELIWPTSNPSIETGVPITFELVDITTNTVLSTNTFTLTKHNV